MSNKALMIEIIGWLGAGALFGGYVLVSFSIVPPDGYIYQFLNLLGALGLGIIALTKKVYPSVTVNLIWGLIAIVAIFRIILF